MSTKLRIGTRGSDLALIQAKSVQASLKALGRSSELTIIKSAADLAPTSPIRLIGENAYTDALDRALLDGEVDMCVHSMKDVPTDVPDGLRIAAIPERESPEDVLVGGILGDLPAGSRVGTGSQRRRALILERRPDVEVVPIRGNVPTRLEKVGSEVDCVVLARAGLHRLNLSRKLGEILNPERFIPSPGQGAICIVTRADDFERGSAADALDDLNVHLAVMCERAFLHKLGGGCQTPAGALAIVERGHLRVRAFLADLYGTKVIRGRREGDVDHIEDAKKIGVAMAEQILERGGATVLAEIDRPVP